MESYLAKACIPDKIVVNKHIIFRPVLNTLGCVDDKIH